MATTVTCDGCGRVIPEGCAAFRLEQPRLLGKLEYGDIVRVDLCDVGCLRGFVERQWPQRTPDFAATKALLDTLAGVADLDERGCNGEYDDAADIEAGLPYSPPAAALVVVR